MSGVNDHDLDGIYAFAVQLGKDAGDMLMTAARRRMEGDPSGGTSSTVAYVQKENSVDIVTKTDNGMKLPSLVKVISVMGAS